MKDSISMMCCDSCFLVEMTFLCWPILKYLLLALVIFDSLKAFTTAILALCRLVRIINPYSLFCFFDVAAISQSVEGVGKPRLESSQIGPEQLWMVWTPTPRLLASPHLSTFVKGNDLCIGQQATQNTSTEANKKSKVSGIMQPVLFWHCKSHKQTWLNMIWCVPCMKMSHDLFLLHANIACQIAGNSRSIKTILQCEKEISETVIVLHLQGGPHLCRIYWTSV